MIMTTLSLIALGLIFLFQGVAAGLVFGVVYLVHLYLHRCTPIEQEKLSRNILGITPIVALIALALV